MKAEKTVYHAKCPKNNQHFLIETERQDGAELVTNFVDVSDEHAEQIGGGSPWPALSTALTLRTCRWCGTRSVGGCRCQKDKGKCPPHGTYAYQCLFCKELVPVLGRADDVHKLRLSVTSPRYDDIAPLLVNMGLTVSAFSSTGFDCDILFINCGTKDTINALKLRDFVRKGGCVYVSDLAVSHLAEAFPGAIQTVNDGQVGTYPTKILDPELNSIIGNQVDVCYDLSAWAKIRWHRGDCLICGASSNLSTPMMITFTEGEGRVFYTSFHNYKQASQKEQAVLKLMLLRQIGSVCNQSIEDIGGALGLNIADLGSLSRR